MRWHFNCWFYLLPRWQIEFKLKSLFIGKAWKITVSSVAAWNFTGLKKGCLFSLVAFVLFWVIYEFLKHFCFMLYLLFSNHMKQFDGYKHRHEIKSYREWERNKCGKGTLEKRLLSIAIWSWKILQVELKSDELWDAFLCVNIQKFLPEKLFCTSSSIYYWVHKYEYCIRNLNWNQSMQFFADLVFTCLFYSDFKCNSAIMEGMKRFAFRSRTNNRMVLMTMAMESHNSNLCQLETIDEFICFTFNNHDLKKS